MGGGIAALAMAGAADAILTGDPTITHFKLSYRKSTPFALESVNQPFGGDVGFGRRGICQISRNADCLTGLWLEIVFPDIHNGFTAYDNSSPSTEVPDNKYAWSNGAALKAITSITLLMGGTQIDKISGDSLYIWSQLSEKEEKMRAYREMTGLFEEYDVTDTTGSKCFRGERRCFVELKFFFTAHTGLSIPTVALQFQDLSVSVEFARTALECITSNGVTGGISKIVDANGSPPQIKCECWATLAFLGNEERNRYANMRHEILITQWSRQDFGLVDIQDQTRKFQLAFSNPVIELIWVFRARNSLDGTTEQRDTLRFSMRTDDTKTEVFKNAKLSIDGVDREIARDARVFRLCRPYMHHTRVPDTFIYTFPLAIDCEGVQPSGALNFSRASAAHLVLTFNNSAEGGVSGDLTVFARSYNVLTLANGLSGLQFST